MTLARRAFSARDRLQDRLDRQFNRFSKRPVRRAPEGNNLIADVLRAGQPALVTRLGGVELQACMIARAITLRNHNARGMLQYYRMLGIEPEITHTLANSMANNAGFFPVNDETIVRFGDLTETSLRHADIVAIWRYRHEDRILQRNCPAARLIDPLGIEPYYHPQPWSRFLAGKRILVIHPYVASITAQIEVRQKLFKNTAVWPECEVKAIPAVQSIAGNRSGFLSWFDALDSMKSAMQQADSDVVIVGAGAYGLPLAAHAKSLGRIAIHMGGATQLLFGIKGRRWEDRPEVTTLYNDHWVRPRESERPPGFETVEGGCYW